MPRLPETTGSELKKVDELVAQVTADIEGQNWSDAPLTERDKELIWMAVRATYARMP